MMHCGVHCGNVASLVFRVRVLVSVTGSVSYLNEKFVLFSLCGALCQMPIF